MGCARELKAGGVSGARNLTTKQGAMRATRNPSEIPADASVFARPTEAGFVTDLRTDTSITLTRKQAIILVEAHRPKRDKFVRAGPFVLPPTLSFHNLGDRKVAVPRRVRRRRCAPGDAAPCRSRHTENRFDFRRNPVRRAPPATSEAFLSTASVPWVSLAGWASLLMRRLG